MKQEEGSEEWWTDRKTVRGIDYFVTEIPHNI
jgi:hypothetical protein